MKRKLTVPACLFLLTAGPLVAEESARGRLEDFTTPILRVPVATAISPDPGQSEAVKISDLTGNRPSPRMSLAPAAPATPLVGLELSSGSGSFIYSSSPITERRLEQLRSEWKAQDLARLERQHREGTPWIHTLDVVFPEPQTFRMGHTEVSGGLVNAFKRRNPFCLLDPFFFIWSF